MRALGTDATERRVMEMARHLLATEPPFSRNKHFDAFRDPTFQKALAMYRRLRALAADLDAAIDAGAELCILDGVLGDRPAKQIVLNTEHARRTAWVPLAAFSLLVERCPRLTEHLD